ncbi:MAG TPA: formate dehydrogenase accessory protein FdhE [Candidatus Dormibacteraeota bacterium]|nr:formate dehydrogenase accessory protein FdhE [Candidatus Dormibacteraeota bacterium]
MAAVLVGADQWTERRRRVRELRELRPFAREVLDLYGALLAVQEDAYHQALATPPPPDRLEAYVAELVMPSVIDAALAAAPERLRVAVSKRLEDGGPGSALHAWIRDEPSPPVDTFLARAATSPVLEALGERAGEAFPGPRAGGTCPRCGAPPQLGWFAAAGEDLATGPRMLMCSRCHTSWGYARMTCPSCGEDSSSRLPIFSEEGASAGERGSVIRGLPTGRTQPPADAVFPHIRIEACDTCRRYLLNVDTAGDPAAVPLVDELAAIPLDLVARDRGFTKITPNLVGF